MALDDFKSFDARDYALHNSKGKEKAPAQLPNGARLADTHCHLSMLDDPALAVARAAHYGFGFLCCVLDPAEGQTAEGGASELSAAQALSALDVWLDGAQQLLAGWGEPETPLPQVRFAVGVHPHNAKDFACAQDELRELLADPRVSCLGEIGLDYHYDLSPRDVQREVFAAQLRLAHETGLPVSLHLREAHDEALEILRREGVPQAGCILHCFNLDTQTMQPFVELGCHIAFGGPLTFKKAYYTRDACLHVPLDKLLTETDAPYMAPEPLRGTVCLPDHAQFSLRMLLDCFGYAGGRAAIDALQPRPSDIENGATPVELGDIDFDALQQGLDAAAFATRVYENAVGLLGRVPTAWQRATWSASGLREGGRI